MSKYQALIDAHAAIHGQLGQPSLHCGHVIYAETEEWCSVDINVKLHTNKTISGKLARFIKEAANPATIRSLLADLERAEKDAQRYRWLKEKGSYEPPRFNDPDGYSEFQVFFWTHSKTLDAAIDAALSQIAGGGEG